MKVLAVWEQVRLLFIFFEPFGNFFEPFGNVEQLIMYENFAYRCFNFGHVSRQNCSINSMLKKVCKASCTRE